MALNYIGSKLSLLDFIENVVGYAIDEKIDVVGDLFAGTGAVGKLFKAKGCKIVSNDIQHYSYVMNKKHIGICAPLSFSGLVSELPGLEAAEDKTSFVLDHLNNSTALYSGFIVENYSEAGTRGKKHTRLYFSDENALLIDTIRQRIETWAVDRKITEDEYYYLLATLLEAADRVANTASVYAAFLKVLKAPATKRLELRQDEIIPSNRTHKIFNDDIRNILNREPIDLLYLDPPYNGRQYDTNYHLLETISRYDNPEITGKKGLRKSKDQKSDFCRKRTVKQAFAQVVLHTQAKYILVSYNNEGLMSLSDVVEILTLRGTPKTYLRQYKRFRADKSENRNYKAAATDEFLHVVRCDRSFKRYSEEKRVSW